MAIVEPKNLFKGSDSQHLRLFVSNSTTSAEMWWLILFVYIVPLSVMVLVRVFS